MKYTFSYKYKEYKGCPEATKLSKNWELFHTMSWAIWLFVLGGGTLGAFTVVELLNNECDITVISQLFIFLFTLFGGYKYVYYSKYTYPKCEELFLLSCKTQENAPAIEQAIIKIKEKRNKETKKATIKFFVIYLLIFFLFTVFFYTA